MATMHQINEIFGRDMGAPKRSGEWFVWEQFGSKSWMREIVGRLKSAKIPAFFNARDRVIGVRADAIETDDINQARLMVEREQLRARLVELDRLLGEQADDVTDPMAR